jgi:hypothetical protein
VGLSGVKGEVLLTARVIVRARGEGVRGILPPAVLDENMPACDLTGVHTAVAIVCSRVISIERQINVSIDDKSFDNRTSSQETQPNGSW